MSSKTLFHVTPTRNAASIIRTGLLAVKAAGKLRAVWLVGKMRRKWAIRHVCARHLAQVAELTVFVVEIPGRQALLRGYASGIWRLPSGEDVPPEWLAGWVAINNPPQT